MAKFGVYAPPKPELPYLAVVIGQKGDVVACEAVKSLAEGKDLLAEVKYSLQEFLDEVEKKRN